MLQTPKSTKIFGIDLLNEEYVQLLVKIKEILNKFTFSYSPKLLAPFYTTYTPHTDCIFGPYLIPPRYLENKL